MKLSRFTSVAFAAAMLLPAAAQAQVTLAFDGVKTPGGDLVGSAATGPYRAHQTAPLPVGATFDIYCLDFDHVAQSSWPATYVTFAQATTGGAVVAANRQLGTEKVWGIQQLRAAAFLSTTFTSTPLTNWDDVHGAIWSMFSNSVPLTAAMTTLASNAVTAQGGVTTWDADYRLVLDTRSFNTDFAAAGLNQAFITRDENVNGQAVVPEPSTYALMGAGLLAIGFARRRRRSV